MIGIAADVAGSRSRPICAENLPGRREEAVDTKMTSTEIIIARLVHIGAVDASRPPRVEGSGRTLSLRTEQGSGHYKWATIKITELCLQNGARPICAYVQWTEMCIVHLNTWTHIHRLEWSSANTDTMSNAELLAMNGYSI